MSEITAGLKRSGISIGSFYRRHIRKNLPILSFAIGFAWQGVMLNRIDNPWVNLILLVDILFLGLLIIWSNLSRSGMLKSRKLLRFARWYPFAIQFLLGGLFSCYVIFYFQSATMTQGPVFILLLLILLVVNQFFEQQLTYISTQAVMYFMAAFSYFTFSLPVVLRKMDAHVFVAGGIVSLSLVILLLTYLWIRRASISLKSYVGIVSIIVVLFMSVNALYYFNLIPPVPLSVKHGGIYHHVERKNGHYLLLYEKMPWYNFWEASDPVIHYSPGDTVFCYVSVFAPTKLQKKIYHRWESYDFISRKWKVRNLIGYTISGGRPGGYRGYTYKYNIFPGKWRVDVLTDEGQLLGRIPFTLVRREEPVEYKRLER